MASAWTLKRGSGGRASAASGRGSDRTVVGLAAMLFVVSAAVIIVWCGSMAAMGGMPMPGGWTMSMAWMRMPGQSWAFAATMFLAMWVVMMAAMMLPSLAPMLLRFRRAVEGRGTRGLRSLTALVGAGYFLVWSLAGLAAYPIGVGLAAAAMRVPALSQAFPVVAGVVVLIAGALQFTAWKARHLACCRMGPGDGFPSPANAGGAFRHGMWLGLHCVTCCGGLMVILLVVGVMNLWAMAVVASAITFERFAPDGERAAHAVGIVTCLAGLLMIGLAIAG
ncbi:Predicted metal-binding membrane protein [Bauldia litoralis]|uniref:Predicted metal-binding membrane protein n=2 Tax=Bauldia litoralis TaxID=665467 RepID=A0A1G6B493_9HYPH|nr:Predicted metal-binding membrane protein [Bauldia litoralis]